MMKFHHSFFSARSFRLLIIPLLLALTLPLLSTRVPVQAADPLPPQIVKEYVVGYSQGAFQGVMGPMVNVNGTLFFPATSYHYATELWKSDGTETGTTMVKNINPDQDMGSIPSEMTDVNGTLFFSADDGTHGIELWKSDGTEAGTTMVKDINPGIGDSHPSKLTNVNGTLFFIAHDGEQNYGLWKSDGTTAGTILVNDEEANILPAEDVVPTNVNGTLFFSDNDDTHGRELWKSDVDGTNATLVKDIIPGIGNSSPSNLTNVNGTLFFTVDNYGASELWKSDGTEIGTIKVKDDISFDFSFSINVNGTLFFVSSNELWKSDGTEGGTIPLTDFSSTGGMLFPLTSDGIYKPFVSIDNTFFFIANDGIHGNELWKSDGTSTGTQLVKDIYPGANEPGILHLTTVNGTLFFSADDGTHGVELWQSDGTTAGTILAADILSGEKGTNPQYMANIGDTLYFSAASSEFWPPNPSLWRYPGSINATGNITGTISYIYSGLAGVTLTASDGSSTTTASDGTYVFSDMPLGTHTITPTLENYVFDPPSITVSVPPGAYHQDFTATADGTVPDTEPSLEVNYQNGQPGSLFIFTGQNLPISASINVTINGVALPFDPPLVTDNTGTVGFMLSTSGLAPGVYKVTITAGDEQVSLAQVISTNTSILLDEAASLRTDEDRSAPMLPVPTTVQPTQPEAEGQRVYLPLVIR